MTSIRVNSCIFYLSIVCAIWLWFIDKYIYIYSIAYKYYNECVCYHCMPKACKEEHDSTEHPLDSLSDADDLCRPWNAPPLHIKATSKMHLSIVEWCRMDPNRIMWKTHDVWSHKNICGLCDFFSHLLAWYHSMIWHEYSYIVMPNVL